LQDAFCVSGKLNIVPTVPPRELEICRRIRHVRLTLHLTQGEMAKRLFITRERLSTYEYGRVSVPYDVGNRFCSVFSINQRWLAEGKEPVTYYLAVQPKLISSPRMLFSTAYEKILKPHVENHLLKLSEDWGVAVEEIDATMESTGSFIYPIGEGSEDRFRLYLSDLVLGFASTLPVALKAEFYLSIKSQIERFKLAHQRDIQKFIESEKETGSFQTMPDNRRYWKSILERLRKATDRRGAKAHLAKDLGITRQAIYKWFSGKGEPSVEVALAALDWLEQCEKGEIDKRLRKPKWR
jgi:transcriptional regulator with XRE-family HTH domain